MSFLSKKEIYKKSNCKLTSIGLAPQYEEWSEEKIIYRQKELAKIAKSIWTIQELTIN